MNVFGKWGTLVTAGGTLVGLALFAHRAIGIWRARKRQRLLATRQRERDRERDGAGKPR